jgi:hypothetical protein
MIKNFFRYFTTYTKNSFGGMLLLGLMAILLFFTGQGVLSLIPLVLAVGCFLHGLRSFIESNNARVKVFTPKYNEEGRRVLSREEVVSGGRHRLDGHEYYADKVYEWPLTVTELKVFRLITVSSEWVTLLENQVSPEAWTVYYDKKKALKVDKAAAREVSIKETTRDEEAQYDIFKNTPEADYAAFKKGCGAIQVRSAHELGAIDDAYTKKLVTLIVETLSRPEYDATVDLTS